MLNTRRAGHLVDVSIVLVVLLIIVSSMLLPAREWVLVGLASAVLTGIGWGIYRARSQVLGLWLIMLGAFCGVLVETGLIMLMLLLIALALIVFEQGLRWGIVAAMLVLATLSGMVFAVQGSWRSVFTQAIGNLVFLMLGITGGLLLQQIRDDRRENRRLLTELRASVDTEKELMLADERSRSARELHDGLGHRLTLIAMNLEYAQRIRDREPEQAWTEVAGAREETRDALAYMRRWVRALNPPREPNLSGNAAFEAIADSFRGTGLAVVVSHTGEESALGKDASLFAYRLVQEGLTNVLRHSDADEVQIALHWRDEQIEIEMRDNGRTAEPSPEDGSGFGLRSLSERAKELGGTFAAERTGQGMLLNGRVPVGPTQ